MKIRKILLLGATFNTDNMGVSALAAGALTILKKQYPAADIFFLDYGREAITSKLEIEGKTVFVPLINMRFSWKVFLPNNIVYLCLLAILIRCIGQTLGKGIIERNGWLKAIYEADFAVAVSGGDSFSDIYGIGRFFYVTLPQILLTIMDKRLIFLPQTIGPLNSRLPRLIAKFLMRHAEIIYSRDNEGISEALTLLNLKENETQKIRFCHDMGFVMEPHQPKCIELIGATEAELKNRTRLLIGLNVSGLLLLGGYNKNNMFNLKVDYQELIDSIIRFLIEEKQADIFLIPHVFGSHEESDSHAVNSVYERLKDKYPNRLFCVSGQYDQNEIKYVIGLCDFFIGSRMHACIAALSQAIPAIGISYSQKFIGVFESVGVGTLIADPKQLTIEEILTTVDKSLAAREEIKNHLQKTMPEIKENILGLLNGIE